MIESNVFGRPPTSDRSRRIRQRVQYCARVTFPRLEFPADSFLFFVTHCPRLSVAVHPYITTRLGRSSTRTRALARPARLEQTPATSNENRLNV